MKRLLPCLCDECPSSAGCSSRPWGVSSSIDDNSYARQKYDLALRVNHSLEYDYQNVYLQVETVFPDGKKTINPLSLNLADKIGTWLGKCGGDGCDITFSFQDDFRFQSLGKHEFSIGQFSRENQLAGISEIELLLFKAGEE